MGVCVTIASIWLGVLGHSDVAAKNHAHLAMDVTSQSHKSTSLGMADLLKKTQQDDSNTTPFSTVRRSSPPVHLIKLISVFRNQMNTHFLAGPEPAKLPEHGYWGEGVKHKDMESITGDWAKEYGPGVAKHPKEPTEATTHKEEPHQEAAPAPQETAHKSGAHAVKAVCTVLIL